MRVKSGIAVVVLALLMAGSQMALAETIYLQCGETRVTVDVTNNTIDNHPATINGTAMSWGWNSTYPDGTTRSEQRHIDRTTGTLTGTFTTCFVSGGYRGTCRTANVTPTTCTKGSAPDTKF